MNFTVWNAVQTGEEVIRGGGRGQRSRKNTDRGTTIPDIIRRTEGDGLKSFASVMEGTAPEDGMVKSVQRLKSMPPGVTALAVTTRTARDYIVSDRRNWKPGTTPATVISTPYGPIELVAPVTVVSWRDGKPVWRSALGPSVGAGANQEIGVPGEMQSEVGLQGVPSVFPVIGAISSQYYHVLKTW